MRKRAAVLLLLAACAEETILAVQDDRSADAGDGAGDGDGDGDDDADDASCRNDDDCRDGDVCDKQGCDAELGTCVRDKVECGTQAEPQCGCDGITYFNECLRRRAHVDLRESEPCRENALSCGGREAECDAPAYCVRITTEMPMSNPCTLDAPGQCWIVPTYCGSEPQGGDRFHVCQEGPGPGPGPGDGPEECLDLCSAITSGLPFVRVRQTCDEPWWE